MNFHSKDIILAHEIIAESKGIKIHYNSNTLNGIVESMNQSFNGKYLHPDIYEKAAILFEHIIRFHPFLDGNKRTAMFSLKLYLRLQNIIFISFPSDVRFLISVAQNCNSAPEDTTHLIRNIQRWISYHCAYINNAEEINGLIDRNIKILENVRYISIQRNNPDILSRSINYWLVEGVYPDDNIDYHDLIKESYTLRKSVNKI
ncbi:MAG: type II toxin-antitoxin system death-on-curing family toxin [Ferroplasma sp.]|uniref:type II toxin-antitoxin system death-on-curing family toxin n=1 Tax=Ferroplasma sp. TaxID=2591003 RepID=UPI0028157A8B|nr:type II toxin-antitoxin system death-on-curing family toxin [Ferroplasma sp.]WMT50582.1 MAG: type II toxin-antitoxin system death-on-curing family toxin [Ferroplasma sp.]